MKAARSSDILVVQDAWSEADERKVSIAFENAVLLEMSVRDKDEEVKFIEKVHYKIKTHGFSSQNAMDEARLDLLLEACNGDGQQCALYLLTEWNYETQISRYLQMLNRRGSYTSLDEYQDDFGNSPLHLSAARGHVTVSQFLSDNYPQMVMVTNLQSDLPVETAIKGSHDDVAAFLIKRMSHYSVLELFRSSKSDKARVNFVELVRTFTMQKTILAILDAMIIPQWPYPVSLHYHNILVGELQDLEDQPTHFEIRYEFLDIDQNGRDPHHPAYQYCPKSPFYYITRQCKKTLQKDLLYHPVIKFASERKWQNYAKFWFRVRFFNYCVFIMMLASGMLGLVSGPDGNPVSSTRFGVFIDNPVNNSLFLWCLVMSFWFLLDEVAEFRREPIQYIKDWTNYWDVSRNILLIVTMFLRLSSNDHSFWYIASLAVFMNALGIFKYSLVFRFTSSYTRAFGLVIFKDIPRFFVVFIIVMMSFVLSIIISLRHTHPRLTINELVVKSGFGLSGSLNGTCTHMRGYTCIMFSMLKVWAFGSPLLENSFDFIGPFPSILVCLLSLTVSVVLFNVLIAQLSHTYQMVQEDSHLSSLVELMHAITTVEFQSRFKIWQVRIKYFLKMETKTTDEMNECMQAYKNALGKTTSSYQNLETKLSETDKTLNQIKEKLDSVLHKKSQV